MRTEITITPEHYVEAVMKPAFFFDKRLVFRGKVTDNRLHLVSGNNGKGYISSKVLMFLIASILSIIAITIFLLTSRNSAFSQDFLSWLGYVLSIMVMFSFSVFNYIRFRRLLSQIKNHPELKQYQLFL